MKKTEQTIQELWNNYKKYNIHIKGMPGGEEREKITGEIFEVVMAENFPKLIRDTKPQIQEAWKTPGKINTPKYHIQTAENQTQRETLERSWR